MHIALLLKVSLWVHFCALLCELQRNWNNFVFHANDMKVTQNACMRRAERRYKTFGWYFASPLEIEWNKMKCSDSRDSPFFERFQYPKKEEKKDGQAEPFPHFYGFDLCSLLSFYFSRAQIRFFLHCPCVSMFSNKFYPKVKSELDFQ